ncbi:MAG: deoxyguanosinetriphosphate triphosphohydrolase [Pseudomonadota bacterium]|nr:deoxyguanosinetriphosphate triphosphohydrolase [Pseudomonadota bacterium]
MSTGGEVRGRLKPYASGASRGRLVNEPESPPRSDFERDRDRIIHSTAFRRLKHKTQVFVYHEGDHYRTRLTHSIEVAQVARSLARSLHLDEDLTEALSLAHDLGHTPFGHAGENELDRRMAAYGGFDHNAQSLRIVTRLERRYALFDGLNLTWETVEGLAKHNGPRKERAVPQVVREIARQHVLDLTSFPSAEAQVAALSDEIAYNAHDIDDGLRARLFDVIDLGDLPLAGEALAEVVRAYPNIEPSRVVHETVRRIISWMVHDVATETERRILAARPATADDVRSLPDALVAFSPQLTEKNRVLQAFLAARMYKHDKVLSIVARAHRVVKDLFEAYMNDPKLLPEGWREETLVDNESGYARQVCDFIAGMTDRYALDQHKRLFDLDPLFR